MTCVGSRDYAAAARHLRTEYYDAHFGPTTIDSPAQSDAEAVDCFRSRAFLQGVDWILRYYHTGCKSWSWYYPAHYPPMCVGLADHVLDTLEPLSLGEPYPTVLQLLSVLPP